MILTRKFLTVFLITLTLCGVQVVQASPLHDHTSHLTGCALCHFDGANAIQPASAVHIPLTQAVTDTPVAATPAPFTTLYPSFHERAPPHQAF